MSSGERLWTERSPEAQKEAAADGFVYHSNGIVCIADDALAPAVQGQLLAAQNILAGTLALRLEADVCIIVRKGPFEKYAQYCGIGA